MKLIGRNRLKGLYGMDKQTDAWLYNWVSELANANWKVPQDVLQQYPKAMFTTGDKFLFKIAEQPHWIEVAITFKPPVVLVVGFRNVI